jgi:serpin B
MFTIAIALVGCSSDEPTPDEPAEPAAETPVKLTPEIETRAIEQTNTFSYTLFNALQNDLSNLSEKNIFISPLSVSMAMSMAANGAVDETRDEIINALGYKDVTTMDGINQVNAKLLADLPTVDPKTTFIIANALWLNKDFSFYESYKTVNETYYNAEVQSLDFGIDRSLLTINQWISDKTNGLINDMLNKISKSAAMYITDALYFKSDWTEEFYNQGFSIKFTNFNNNTVTVPELSDLRNMLYNSNSKCEIATLPFGNGSYQFSVILPNKGISVVDAVSSLDNSLFDNSTTQLVSFKMPKFSFENTLTLNDYLNALNIKRAFTNKAQFSRICTTDGLMISNVLHNTKIDLNENGVEAAAATVIEMESELPGGGGTSPQYIEFSANRPFAFLIREKTTGAIIFIGAINKL